MTTPILSEKNQMEFKREDSAKFPTIFSRLSRSSDVQKA